MRAVHIRLTFAALLFVLFAADRRFARGQEILPDANRMSPEIKTRTEIQAYYDAIDEALEKGDGGTAIRLYDEIIDKFQDYVNEDGRIITLLYHRALAHGYPRLSTERRLLFEEIWNNPALAEHPRIYNIGRMVAMYAYRSGDFAVAEKYADSLVERLGLHYDEIPADERKRFGVDTAYMEGLLYSARSKGQLMNADGAIAAYQRLQELFPGSIFSEVAENEIRNIRDREVNILSGIDLTAVGVLDGSEMDLHDSVVEVDVEKMEAPAERDQIINERAAGEPKPQRLPVILSLFAALVGIATLMAVSVKRRSLK